MSDQFTSVTSQGYGSRLGGSLVGMLFGTIILPVAIGVLYWNEGRAVIAATALHRGAAAVVEVSAAAVDRQAASKLVHTTGEMQAATPAKDPVFDVTADGLLRLSRNAETYQWKEDTSTHSEDSIGGTKTTETTFKYERVWPDQAIDSANFKHPEGHENPAVLVRPARFDGGGVTLGAYKVDPSLLDQVSQFSPLQPAGTAPAGYRTVPDGFYHGQDLSQPAIGDVRVRFTAVPAQTVSVAAALSADTLTAFRDANGYSIALVEPGAVPAAALFQDARHSEQTLTWILRGAGFVTILFGFVLLAAPVTTLFSALPFLGSLVGAGALLIAAAPLALVALKQFHTKPALEAARI
jgi:hypothetical protein